MTTEEKGGGDQDSPQAIEPTPGEETPTTPPSEPKPYTQAQIDKLVNDGKAEAGREAKAAKDAAGRADTAVKSAQQRAEAAEAALTKFQEDRDRADFEAAKDDPDLLASYRSKTALREREAANRREKQELDASKAQHAADLEEVKQWKVEKTAADIVKRPEYAGVDPALLVTLTDGSPEKMEALAKVMAGTKPKPAPKTPELPPDPGITEGGAGSPSIEQGDSMTDDQYMAMAKKRDKGRL